MDRLPRELWMSVAAFADHESLHAMELTCRLFFWSEDKAQARVLWQQSVVRSALLPTARDYRYITRWKHFACACEIMDKEPHVTLFEDVLDVSSVHRHDEECASNTLNYSQCYRVAAMLENEEPNHILNEYNIQRLICDCSGGDCYWSSAPTLSREDDDFIVYSLLGTCIIESIQVIPYQAFWQTGEPAYAPCQVSMALHEDKDTEPVYVSPAYDVENTMELQTFQLPHKVLARGNVVVRINLIGKQQYEYVSLGPGQPLRYYCCMSYITVRGVFYTAS